MKRLIPLILVASLLFSFSTHYDVYKGFRLKDFERSLVLIPAGEFIQGTSDEDAGVLLPNHEGNFNKSRLVRVDSFYISRYEVSNGQYLEFLSGLNRQDTNLYKAMLPDTLVWREKSAYNEPYVEYYLRHPAYSNYPVVGISYEQAEAYCDWLTKKYLQEPKRKFRKVRFRLPATDQWMLAAEGKNDFSLFPWEGTDVQNKKGEARANFLFIDQAGICRDSVYEKNIAGELVKKQVYGAYYAYNSATRIKGNDRGDITVPVKYFEPNAYGLYNMAGNVEEFMREKGKTHGGSWRDPAYYLQNQVFETHDSLHSASPERGFRYMMEIIR